jgi:hypothetical protein
MTVVKQYGELRTGTNLMRLLLVTCFPDLLVLMHVLGGKHHPPSNWPRIWSEAQSSSQPDVDFVARASLEAPAESTDLTDPDQRAHLHQTAKRIESAYRQHELGVVVSVREPMSWLVSLRRFEITMLRRPATPASVAARRYDANYRSWLALADAGHRVVVVKHEDLVKAPTETLTDLAATLHLPQPTRPVVLPSVPTRPCRWDHLTPEVERYHQDTPGTDLRPERIEEITRALDLIDDQLLAALGYPPAADTDT